MLLGQPGGESLSQAAQPQERQAQAADRQTGRPQRTVAQAGRASGPMVTVALRGESAQRLRTLAAAQEMSLSKLLAQVIGVHMRVALGGGDAAMAQ